MTRVQTKAIGMTKVKTKFEANTSRSKIIRTFYHVGKLFRSEVIWIGCFHWSNITTCGKYACACVMLVSLAAVFSLVTQRSSPQNKERCVTRLKTAARESSVMPEWYFVYTCYCANARISASTRKRKKLIPMLALVLMPSSRSSSQ